MRILLIVVSLFLGSLPSLLALEMRDRVFCDYESGTAFRFPYHYRAPDMYRGVLYRPGAQRGGTMISVPEGSELSSEQIQQLVRQRNQQSFDDASVRHFSTPAGEVPPVIRRAGLEAVFGLISAGSLSEFTSFAYYAENDAQRPHADPDWAPEGITAVMGSGEDRCGLLVKHGERYSGVLCQGSASDPENQAILDSFEVLAGDEDERQTWRAAQFARGRVIDAGGGLVRARGSRAINAVWPKAWEAETGHYHVTCSVSPARVAYWGAIMDTLYTAYVGIYDPDKLSPFKMEIHVFNDQQQFRMAAAETGFGGLSPTALGFFSPSHLCIYAFDKMPPRMPTTCESVLAHEASHQFLHMTCNGSGHVPTWVNEGLAVYFETGQYIPGRMRWEPPTQRIQQLRRYYGRAKSTAWPLQKYIDYHGHIPALNYAEVYAITHFFLFLDRKYKKEKRFQRYWEALRKGEDGAKAFEEIFLQDMIEANDGSLTEAYKQWSNMLMEYVNQNGPLRELR
ncbi:MAG: DUF1570 domain-containing protein [Planctomycetota bacterium]